MDIYEVQTYELKKGGYMDTEVCGFSGVWEIFWDILLDGVDLPVYHWDYIQVGLCDVMYFCPAGLDWC